METLTGELPHPPRRGQTDQPTEFILANHGTVTNSKMITLQPRPATVSSVSSLRAGEHHEGVAR